MPDVLKALLKKYPDLKPVKMFPFDTREDGCVRYAFYGKGKTEDGIIEHVKEAYEALARNGDLRVWKLPKAQMIARFTGIVHQGLPSSEESFYNFVYVLVPEVDHEAVAEELNVELTDKRDDFLYMQSEDLGYLFKRKE